MSPWESPEHSNFHIYRNKRELLPQCVWKRIYLSSLKSANLPMALLNYRLPLVWEHLSERWTCDRPMAILLTIFWSTKKAPATHSVWKPSKQKDQEAHEECLAKISKDSSAKDVNNRCNQMTQAMRYHAVTNRNPPDLKERNHEGELLLAASLMHRNEPFKGKWKPDFQVIAKHVGTRNRGNGKCEQHRKNMEAI